MSQNSRNQGFSYYISLMIEGFGSGSRAVSRSESISLTNGSGWPKNMWIRIRIRIRNTAAITGVHEIPSSSFIKHKPDDQPEVLRLLLIFFYNNDI